MKWKLQGAEQGRAPTFTSRGQQPSQQPYTTTLQQDSGPRTWQRRPKAKQGQLRSGAARPQGTLGKGPRLGRQELRRLWVEKVKNSPLALEYASEDIKADPEVVLAAVGEYGPAFRYAAEHLKADPEVVLAAVKANPSALQFASERFLGDRKSILELVRATKAAFLTWWAAEELREDAEFMAQCRAAAGTGLVWSFYRSYTAFEAMTRSLPTAGASVPGGEAYEQVMEAVRDAAHGSASEAVGWGKGAPWRLLRKAFGPRSCCQPKFSPMLSSAPPAPRIHPTPYRKTAFL